MLNECLMDLQNGSDIRGIAIDGVADEMVNLTPERVNMIIGGFIEFLTKTTDKKKSELRVGIGIDSRITGPELKLQAIMALTESDVITFDCGLASTPAMFMGCIYEETAFDGAIMLTASHLPYNRNGIKFFTIAGGLEKENIREVLQYASNKKPVCGDVKKRNKYDLIGLYAGKLSEKICQEIKAADYQKPLQGMKIVVDAGNGAGGFFVEKILNCLGAETKGSLFLEPDGYFPNHIPNPEDKIAMEYLSTAVLKEKADLGLIFDTDVDRMSAVLSNGQSINRDYLIAMMAAIVAKDNPKGIIVTDSVTSDELTLFLENSLHLEHYRFKRGYKNVINECKRLNEEGKKSPLAIETSGHGALAENYYLDDGAYLAVKLLIQAAKMKQQGENLAMLLANMKPMGKNGEYRKKILVDDFKKYGNVILTEIEEKARANKNITIVKPSYEGLRLAFHGEAEGWALLRLSLHDPVLAVNIQENRCGDYDKLVAQVNMFLAGYKIAG